MPSTHCATSIPAGPPASAASAQPKPPIASSTSAVRRTPQRSSPTPTGTMASAKAAGKAPVSAASASGVRPRSRDSTSAAIAGSVRTAFEKTCPKVSARIGSSGPRRRGTASPIPILGGSVPEHLAGVEDALRVEAGLDAAHHRQRLGAMLGLEELALAEAHAMLARAGAAERQAARDDLAVELQARSSAAGSFGSKRMIWW